MHVLHEVDEVHKSQFAGQPVEVTQTPFGHPLQFEGQELQFVPSYKYPVLQPQHLLRLHELHPGGQQYPFLREYPTAQSVQTSYQSQVVHLLKHLSQPPVTG